MSHADPRDQRIAELEGRITQLETLLTAALVKIEKLETENAELRAQLKLDSTNSSKPPSSDPPSVPRPQKDPTGRARGGQRGHKHHKRELLPPEKVNRFVDLKPSNCDRCRRPLEGTDPNPRRRQIVDLPKIEPDVTEVRYHALCCPDCGIVSRPGEPANLPGGSFGSRLVAVVALLTGKLGVSKRSAREFVSDVLGIDFAGGSISNTEQVVSEAAAGAVAEARDFVRCAPSAHLDETGWREDKRRAWLWVAATALVSVFTIARSRGKKVALEILNEGFAGVVISDRWAAYSWLLLSQRPIGGAHVKRDFQGMVDRGGPGKQIGEALLVQLSKMFRWWARVRDGSLPRERFQRRMRKVERRIGDLLRDGEVCPDGRVSGMCAEILKVESALWTFVRTEGIEPTNNAAKRDLRRAVLWRKGCFGTDSENGSRYAERILTVTTTLRKQKRPALDFLAQSVDAAARGKPRPSLLPEPRVPAA